MFGDVDRGRFDGKRVGVLYGGSSPERPVSLQTGPALAAALRAAGFDVAEYDLPADLGRLVSERPAAALLGLHGGEGEDGTIQGFLGLLGIPYSGSGVLASALAMDKDKAKTIMAAAGVPVISGARIAGDALDLEGFRAATANVPGPWCLKPNDAGSSVGVHMCQGGDEVAVALADLSALYDAGDITSALVETVIVGAEYSVGFFDGECLGVIEITPADGFYDFAAKYETHDTTYAPVDGDLAAEVARVALGAWDAIGCRGVGRVDVMGVPGAMYALEVNTIPGMTSTSLVPKLAAARGVPFDEFAALMVCAATGGRS